MKIATARIKKNKFIINVYNIKRNRIRYVEFFSRCLAPRTWKNLNNMTITSVTKPREAFKNSFGNVLILQSLRQ